MRSKVVSIVIVCTAVLGLLLATKNVLSRIAVERGVEAVTGLPLKIRRLEVGAFNSVISLSGLRLSNPSGFPEPLMISVPDVYVRYDLPAFFRGLVHLREVRLHVEEVVVVRRADGRVNIEAFKPVQESKSGAAETKEQPGKPLKFLVDRFHLKLGKVVMKDYTRGETPAVQEFPLNLDREYTHITNPAVFAGVVMSEAIMNTTIARLTGLDLGPLQNMVGQELSGAISGATGAAKEVTERLGGAAKELTGTADTAVKGAADSLKKLLGQ